MGLQLHSSTHLLAEELARTLYSPAQALQLPEKCSWPTPAGLWCGRATSSGCCTALLWKPWSLNSQDADRIHLESWKSLFE